MVLRILISLAIVKGVIGSTKMFVRGESQTVPVTGQCKLPVKGVDIIPLGKCTVVPVTGRWKLPVTGVYRSPFGKGTIVSVTGH